MPGRATDVARPTRSGHLRSLSYATPEWDWRPPAQRSSHYPNNCSGAAVCRSHAPEVHPDVPDGGVVCVRPARADTGRGWTWNQVTATSGPDR